MRNLTSILICVLSFEAALAGQARRDAFVLPGDQVIPQIATGGDAFFMAFQFVSFTDGPATVQLSFFDGLGLPMMISHEQDGAPLTDNVLTDTIAAGGIEFAVTSPSGPVQIGYALVESIPENAVAVSTAFNQIVPGRPLFQSFVPMSTALHNRFFVPFLNAGALTGAIAVVSLVTQDVTFTARDNGGIDLCNDTQSFGAGEHVAFVIHDRLACTAGIDGVLEVRGSSIGLAGFGVTAQDEGAFVTQPVYGEIPD